MKVWVAVALVAICAVGCVRSPQTRALGWWSVESEHVRLQTDLSPEGASEMAWLLEDLHLALAHLFPECAARTADNPIDVTVLSRGAEYEEVEPFPSSGFFMRPVEDLVATPARIVTGGDAARGAVGTSVFVHELTHRFVHACYPDAPPWLHEGLAVYHEDLRVRGDRIDLGRSRFRFTNGLSVMATRAGGGIITYLPTVRVPRASELVQLTGPEFYLASSEQVAMNYGGAWALVHLLSLGPQEGLRRRFAAYLELLARAQVPERVAFERTFGGVELDAALLRHIRSGVRGVRRAPYAPPQLGRPDLRPADAQAIHLLRAELHLRRGQPDDMVRAQRHLDELTHPVAQARGLLLRAWTQTGEARAELIERAARLAPRDLHVLRARVWQAVAAPGSTEALHALGALSARPHLRSVDLSAMAELRLARGEVDLALPLAEQSLRADPTSMGTRLTLGIALSQSGRTQEARRQFRIVHAASAHHDPTLSRRAQALMSALAE